MRTTAENSQIQTIHNCGLKILHPLPILFLYKEKQADSSVLEREWKNEYAESTSICLKIQNLKTHKTAIRFFRQKRK